MRRGNARVPDTMRTVSRLEGLLKPAALTGSAEKADLTIEERRGVVQLQLIARNGKAPQLTAGIMTLLGRTSTLAPMEGDGTEELFVCATGPLEYWVLIESEGAAEAVERIRDISRECASLFDQSHGRFVVRLSGPRAQSVLGKGTALDLRPSHFPARGGAHTTIAHIPALVIGRGPAVFDVSAAASYAGSFVAWLKEAGRKSLQ